MSKSQCANNYSIHAWIFNNFYGTIFCLSHIIIIPKFISILRFRFFMLGEVITIAVIIGGCAAAVWYAKKKFQPEIERNLEKLERSEAVEEFVYKKRRDF